ncbi:acid protease [Schizopora paradoxa]|uniref:Acid protease n=1 Tax=Schizopora paradoxa TaxID=27342 RepID=A0A0H2SJ99_9AGAM|nr:acid protease [Schizopora paradoxa]
MRYFLPLTVLGVILDGLLAAEARSVVVNLQQDVSQSHSLSRRAEGINQVAPASDSVSYYTLMSIGDIAFRIALDTGSSDLWLLSSDCLSSQCKSVPTYPLNFHSPSFGIINGNSTTFNLSFADTTVATGYLATENVQLSNFTIPDQIFGVVNNTNVTLNSQVSGLLGLGFPRLSEFSARVSTSLPFLNRLAQQGLMDYPLFGISLTRNMTGSLSLGAIDTSVVQNISLIEWHPVMPFSPFGAESNTSRYLQWAIPINALGVNGTSVAPQPTYPDIVGSSLALLDIGTNGIFGPYQDVSRMFDLIEGARLVDEQVGQWVIPCDTQVPMTFSFGHGNFTLQPTDYIIGPTTGEPSLCLAWPRASADVGDGIDWQLGTPFLRTVYSVFSFGISTKEPPMIGLYEINNSTTSNETISQISSFLASASPTITTTVPNSLLSTVTPTPVSYIFNTSVPASLGQIVASELGNSTYSPLLNGPTINASAIPAITPSPTLQTFIITDGTIVFTSTSVAATSSVALGRPPGVSGSKRLSSPPSVILGHLIGSLALLLFVTQNFLFVSV